MRAALLPYRGVVLEARAAVAFLAVFEAGQVEVVAVGAAVRLTGFDGHAGGVCVGGAGEGAGGYGVVGAAEVRPSGGGELADGGGVN